MNLNQRVTALQAVAIDQTTPLPHVVEAEGMEPSEVTVHVGFKLPHNLVYPHEKGEKREEELVRKERK